MAPLRFICTGDIQIHQWKQFSYTRKDGLNSRLYNCAKVFDILRKEAEDRGIEKIFINGDVFEENAFIEVETYDLCYRKLEDLHRHGMDVVVNLGNHDVLKESSGRVLHALRAFRRVATIVEKPTLVWDHLQVVPWTSNADELKATIASLDGDGRRNALALHVGISGAKTGPTSYLLRAPIHLKDIRRKDFSVVLLSDYHTRQSLARNVFYLGSPLQHSFGETHRPCIWEITLDGQEYLARKIYTNLPSFVRVSIKNGQTLRDLKRERERFVGNYVRIELGNGASLSDEEIESFASKHGFQVQISHRETENSIVEGGIKTLEPEEAIQRYVEGHAKRKTGQLVRLGQKIYRGEL